jgi:hypothetical protein
MTDERTGDAHESDDRTPASKGPPPEATQPSQEPDNAVDEMEQGIERVDEHIQDAKDKAERAETLDPQPMSDGGGDDQNSTS